MRQCLADTFYEYNNSDARIFKLLMFLILISIHNFSSLKEWVKNSLRGQNEKGYSDHIEWRSKALD